MSRPVAVGLGISTPLQCSQAGALADAVIVGSAIVRLVGRDRGWSDSLAETVGALAEATGSGGILKAPD